MDRLFIWLARYLYVFVPVVYSLYFLSLHKRQRIDFIVQSGLTLVLTALFGWMAGVIYFHPRPFVTNHTVPLIAHAPDNGFPSDHTLVSAGFASALFPFNRKVSLALVLMTLMVGAARIYVGVHSWIDILGSIGIAILGAFAAHHVVKIFNISTFELFLTKLFTVDGLTDLKTQITNPVVKKNLLKISILFVTIASLLIFGGLEIKESQIFNATHIQIFLRQFGPLASLGYIALLILAVMTPIPNSVIILAGGFIFGPIWGSFLAVAGEFVGAIINFVLARRLGRKYITAKFPKATAYIDQYSKRLGWQTVFLLRLTPSASFDLLSYASGISTLSLKAYAAATLAGMIPLVITTVVVGSNIGLGSLRGSLITIIMGTVSIIIITKLFHLHQKKTSVSR